MHGIRVRIKTGYNSDNFIAIRPPNRAICKERKSIHRTAGSFPCPYPFQICFQPTGGKEDIIAITAIEIIRAITANEQITTFAAFQNIAACTTLNGIIAAKAPDIIASFRTTQHIIKTCLFLATDQLSVFVVPLRGFPVIRLAIGFERRDLIATDFVFGVDAAHRFFQGNAESAIILLKIEVFRQFTPAVIRPFFHGVFPVFNGKTSTFSIFGNGNLQICSLRFRFYVG